MKLLSICVPTYNRAHEIQELSANFMTPALDLYEDRIEIVVCDNSDAMTAAKNAALLDSRVRYHKNADNLGFAGNFMQCVEESIGSFIWVISDDDPVIWDGFTAMVEMLSRTDTESLDCLMLPYLITENLGCKFTRNRPQDLGVSQGDKPADLFSNGQIPFILFSSAIVRLRKDRIAVLREKYFGNDYLQVMFFLEMMDPTKPIVFLDKPVIDYTTEYIGRTSVDSMAASMHVLRDYLNEKLGVPTDEAGQYSGWLRILMHHRGGYYKIKNADKDRWIFLASLPCHIGLRNIILATLLVLPKPVFFPVYLVYRAFTDLKGQRRSPRAFLRRMWINGGHIRSLKKRDVVRT